MPTPTLEDQVAALVTSVDALTGQASGIIGTANTAKTTAVAAKNDVLSAQTSINALLAAEQDALAAWGGAAAAPYLLDGLPPAAIFSAPGGAFRLDSGSGLQRVSLSSLLSFSSGQKYTVGPDGNYMLNAANGPAWDWSTGRRRLLIEAISATNYWLNSDSMPGGNVSNGSVAFASNALLGSLTLTTLTKTASNLPTFVASGALSVGASGASTFTIAVVAGNLTTCSFGILGSVSTWGTNGNAVASVVSGPGSISQNTGSLFNVSGLSSTPTIITVTKTSPSAETVAGCLYQQPTNSGTAGDTLKYGRGQLEPGSTYSSYTVCGASPTARPADIVTAASGLLALLTGANATLVIRGKRLGANPASSVDPLIGSTNRSASVEAGPYNAFAVSAAIDVLSAAPTATPISDVGVAVSWTAGQRKMAVNGGAVAKDNFALFSASDSGLQLFRGADGYANGYLDELSLWPIYASDAGLGAHAHVYA